MMDINTAGGAIFITVFRLLHIIAAVIWVGAGIIVSMYFEPALQKSGVDTSKVIRALYTKSGFDKLMPIVSITTTIAGLVLYWLVTDGFASVDYMRSGQGIVLSIGAVFGLLAFGHGFAALGGQSRKYAKLIEESGDNPNQEQQKALHALEAKLMRHGKISMWLGVAALVFMAGARYMSPLISMG